MIFDYSVSYELRETDAVVRYEVVTTSANRVAFSLYDTQGVLAVEGEGFAGSLNVPQVKL